VHVRWPWTAIDATRRRADEGATMRLSGATVLVLGLSLALAGGAAEATTMSTIERTCPIGGEVYESFQINSTTRLGSRLDMRPMGPAAALPWVECPNGFIVYKDEKEFTAAEIATLTPIVAGDTYQRLRREHVAAYRVVHLQRALGKSDREVAWLLLKAAWEAEDEGKEPLRQAYLIEAEAALEARAAAGTAGSDDWWTAQIVIAEVERQRSRFPEALAALDVLPTSQLPADDIRLAVIKQIRDHATRGDAKPAAIER
jgi:hypothetical protein